VDARSLPAAVAASLASLQAIEPAAIVAGGFLRDRLMGVAPKDIDLFCRELTGEQQDAVARAFPGARVEPFSKFLSYQSPDVARVWDLGEAGGYPLQLIEVRGDPAVRAAHHDFGLCQVWHDGQELVCTDAFELDAQRRTFTLCHCESKREFDRSMKRFERLSNKYLGFALVIPYEFKEWEFDAQRKTM